MEQVRILRLRGPNTGLAWRWFKKRGGEAAWGEFVSTLSAPCRAAFERSPGLYEWVDEVSYTELARAFMAQAQGHDAHLAGEVAARAGLTTVNQWILRVLSPSFLISNLPRLWSFYHDGGAVHLERLEDRLAMLSLYAEGCVPEYFHPGLSGWIRTALELTGAQGVEIEYTPPGTSRGGLESCRHHFLVRWH
jgi:hypothetical protein